MGRPSLKTDQVLDRIIEGLGEGIPLAKLCREDGMPKMTTVYDWLAADATFSERYARAREAGFDVIAVDCLEIADYSERDTTETDDGREIPNHEFIQRSKLRVDTRMRLLKCWDPKRYGDRQVLAGDPDAPLQGLSDEALDAKLAALMEKHGNG